MIRVFLTIIHDVKHNKTLIKIILIAQFYKKRGKSLNNITVTYLPKEDLQTFDTNGGCLRNKFLKLLQNLYIDMTKCATKIIYKFSLFILSKIAFLI